MLAMLFDRVRVNFYTMNADFVMVARMWISEVGYAYFSMIQLSLPYYGETKRHHLSEKF